MNDIYVTNTGDPIQSVNEVGPIADGCSLTGIDDSLLLDLDDSDAQKRFEHRYHQRFRFNKEVFALIRSISIGPLKLKGKSMGSIACAVFDARPVKLGKIDNISMGGLMFHHADSKTNFSKPLALDILLADCGFYLNSMPYKIISDTVIPEDVPDESIEMHQVRLQFQNLNLNQRVRLKNFILNHGIEIGKISANE